MTMKLIVVQTEWNDFRVKGIHADYVLRVRPETGHPHGRKAMGMSVLWGQLRAATLPGLLWADPDVAADLDDLAAMRAAVAMRPSDVHTAMVKLWPISTGLDDWIWSHRGGTLGFPAATQDESVPVSYFAMGLVWTPARLLDLAFPRFRGWAFHEIDVGLSEICMTSGIPRHAVAGCRPKHLHFAPEHHWGYRVPGTTSQEE